MKITLIDYQKNALEILLYTKNTRLQGEETLESISQWPMQKKLDHLDYMLHTINSSWEFANYIFEIQGVSRAFTHQLVRTRTASYAQQSQRTVDVRDIGAVTPDFYQDNMDMKSARHKYENAIEDSFDAYSELIDQGVPVQDARAVLPAASKTNIIFGANLRTLSHMAELRLCTRAQGEYQEVFKAMRNQVLEVHPWASDFIQVYCVKHGICAFPYYDKCPIQKHTIKITKERKQDIFNHWIGTKHEAIPVAKDGKTMDNDHE